MTVANPSAPLRRPGRPQGRGDGSDAFARRRRPLVALGWIALLAVTLAVLHACATVLPAPPRAGSIDGLGDWLDDLGPVGAALAVVRLLALGVTWYLVAVSALTLVARLTDSRSLARAALALTPRLVRAAVRPLLGAGLSVSLLGTMAAGPGPAVAAPVRAGPTPAGGWPGATIAAQVVRSDLGPATGPPTHAPGSAPSPPATAPPPTIVVTPLEPVPSPPDAHGPVPDADPPAPPAPPAPSGSSTVPPPDVAAPDGARPPSGPTTPTNPTTPDADAPGAHPGPTASGAPDADGRILAEAFGSIPALGSTRAPGGPPGAAPADVPAPRPTPAPAPTAAAAAATWTIAPGDHLWRVAEVTLRTAWGRAARDDEVVPYWHAVIDANRDRLLDPANPDLVVPGQELVLPPPPPHPDR